MGVCFVGKPTFAKAFWWSRRVNSALHRACQRYQRYIWAPETTTSVVATAGWLAVLGSGVTADAPELGAPAIKPPLAGAGDGQFIG